MKYYGRLETKDFEKMGFEKAEDLILDVLESNGVKPELSWKRDKKKIPYIKEYDVTWVLKDKNKTRVVSKDRFVCLRDMYEEYADEFYSKMVGTIKSPKELDEKLECLKERGWYTTYFMSESEIEKDLVYFRKNGYNVIYNEDSMEIICKVGDE